MEEDKRYPEDCFLIFFQQNTLPMWIYDLDTLKFIAVNNSAVHHYGYTEKEFLSMTIKDIRPQEDIQRLLGNISLVQEGLDHAGEWRHIKKDGSVIDVEITSHVIIYKGRKAELVSAKDITRSKKAENQLKETVGLLNSSLKGIIEVVATIVESRAAYTAHHQRRTAELVKAITSEMGLEENQAEGAEMAALIHDLGEMAIPAEILNRTCRLSEIEYSLVKTHSQVGYDSLKGINFPWPIAKIILQHHERLDGSGYPHGIKENDILLEAKIVGLAEVVEAMCSHRPYRAAMSINEALEEIYRGKRTLFDPQIVDICISLFQEKNFVFSS